MKAAAHCKDAELRNASTDDLNRRLAEIKRKRGVKEVPIDVATSSDAVLPPAKDKAEQS
jgi:hypothetical protein